MKKILVLFLVLAMFVSGCGDKNSIINGTAANKTLPEAAPVNNTVNNEPALLSNASNPANESDDNSSLTQVIIPKNESEPDESGAAENLTGYFGKLEVSFIDVGHGDSIFVFMPHNGTMLIDGGDDSSGPAVTKQLRKSGIFYYLDVMIATNPKDTHVGGLDSISYNMMQVSEIYDNGQGSSSQSYESFRELSSAKGIFLPIKKDSGVIFDKDSKDVNIELIIPYKDGYSNTSDNSIVVKMKYKDIKFLFMSDCDVGCEKKLEGYDLKADILKVGNYAINSTSQAFLDAVNPKVAIISTGDFSSNPKPDEAVIARLEAKGIQILRTDLNGTIVIDSTDGKTYTIKAEQKEE